MKQLSDHELETRRDSDLYFKNGEPKKQYMLCRDPQYVREVTRINGYCNPDWICGGSRCPLYSTGCDDRGRDWESNHTSKAVLSQLESQYLDQGITQGIV